MFFLCLLALMHMQYGSLAISIREICCWQAEPRSVPGPLTTLCLWDPWNVQECGLGQVEKSSSETDTQTQLENLPASPLFLPPQLVFPPPRLHPACSFSFKFPFTLRLKNECQETTLLFSLCTRWAEEKGRQTNWREKVDLTWEQESRCFLLFSFSWQFSSSVWWTGFGHHCHHTYRDISILLQMDCQVVSGKKTKKTLSFPALAHSICLSKTLDRYFFRLNWRNNLPEVELDEIGKKKTSTVSFPHPPSTHHPLSFTEIVIVS